MNEPSEMPTPRTDRNKFELAFADGPDTENVEFVVDANICAQLERDLSTLRKAAEAARVKSESIESLVKRAIELVERIQPGNCSHKAGNIRVLLYGAKDKLASLRSELESKSEPSEAQ